MRIGDYETVDEPPIGDGGGGIVYRAHHVLTGQLVAIKQTKLPPGVDRAHLEQRFLREAKAMGAISSDHVVRLYTPMVIDGRPTLVMEYIDGGTLEAEMAHGAFGPAEVARLLWETLQGLEAVHAAGFLHRDLKPANILRSSTGRYKLADFSISGEIGAINTLHAGSVQYAAPEYMSDPAHVDGRADLYSLGLCAYEAALGIDGFKRAFQQHAGVDPFVANAQWQAWLADPTKEVPPLHHVSPEVPLELSKFVSRLLTKDRAHRFESSREAVEQLKLLEIAQGISRPSTTGGTENVLVSKHDDGVSSRRTTLIVGGIAIAATVMIVAVGVASKSRRPAPFPVPAPTGSTGSGTPPRPPPSPPTKRTSWNEFEDLANGTNERLQILNVRSSYGIGDTMQIDISLPRGGYLNVLTVSDATDGATVLFPNDFARDNHVEGRRSVHLPQPGAHYKFGFAIPDGQTEEQNLLVAFLTDRNVNARDLASGTDAFRELTPDDASATRAAIVQDASYAAGKATYSLKSAPTRNVSAPDAQRPAKRPGG